MRHPGRPIIAVRRLDEMPCLALPCLVFFLLELLRLVLLLGAAARPQPSDRPSDRRHHHDNPSICIAELFLLPISLPLLLPSVAVDAATPFIEIIFQDAMRCAYDLPSA